MFIGPGILIYIFKAFKLEYEWHTHLFPYLLYPCSEIALCSSIYMTVAIAIERFIGLCRPFRRLSTRPCPAKAYIFPVLIFSIGKYYINTYLQLLLTLKLIFNRLKYSQILGEWNQRTKRIECTRRNCHLHWLHSHFFESTSRLHSLLHNVDSFINYWHLSICHVGGLVYQDLLSYEKIQSPIENYGYSSCSANGHFR